MFRSLSPRVREASRTFEDARQRAESARLEDRSLRTEARLEDNRGRMEEKKRTDEHYRYELGFIQEYILLNTPGPPHIYELFSKAWEESKNISLALSPLFC